MASGIPFSQDLFFGPSTIHAMVTAFDKACRSLHEPGRRDRKGDCREAHHRPGPEGDTDPDHLCEATLKALGFDRSADR